MIRLMIGGRFFMNSKDNYIYSFDELSKLIGTMKRNSGSSVSAQTLYTAELCIYLSWLGLWENQIKQVSAKDYIKHVNVLSCGTRYIYINEQKIADVLIKIGEHISGNIIIAQDNEEFEKVKKLCADNGLALDHVYKMRLFYEKYEFETKHAAEDLLRLNGMVCNLGIGETIKEEYAQYAFHRTMADKN